MKTIITTLPIYNKLSKQCYERSSHVRQLTDLPPMIACPRHRLPSFQWLDESDGAATITAIELIDTLGESYNGPTNLLGWTNTSWETLTTSGLDITSAINTGGGFALATTTQTYAAKAGETIRVKGDFARTSGGVVQIIIYEDGAPGSFTNLSIGTNTVTFTFVADCVCTVGFYASGGDCNVSFTNVEITVDRINQLFTALPASHAITGDVYFIYNGDTLKYLLPVGQYYLKIRMNTGHIYYSEWFEVDCVYENLITSLTNEDYNTFTSSGTTILSAIETGASGVAKSSNLFSVNNGDSITFICYLTRNSGQLPFIIILAGVLDSISNQVQLAEGLNVITLTVTDTRTDAYFRIFNNAAANFSTSEILVNRSYSEDYLTLNFHNDCDLGDILYHAGFTQTLWFKSEPMETTFPQEEEGIKNGEGRFIRSFARQVKKYLIRTLLMPDYMVEVFHRMKLHDTVTLIDLVGDENDIYNLEVEHEWYDTDKYYAKIELTFDYNEEFVIGGCCNDIS